MLDGLHPPTSERVTPRLGATGAPRCAVRSSVRQSYAWPLHAAENSSPGASELFVPGGLWAHQQHHKYGKETQTDICIYQEWPGRAVGIDPGVGRLGS